ncbi:hypothetical protein HAX54_006441 [Datura stramonium]|uniref:Uncharacterized protein n=1 Tax=Datura stramonium TaxID=4076 RepID=A0ABS8TAA7_DATST|nr:hypothetical protein [Datura stramonium]
MAIAHTESLKRIDDHMSHILDQDEQSIIDFGDAFVGDEEDYFAYYIVVTLWSGKIFQSRLYMHMEGKTIDEDEENPDHEESHEEVVVDYSAKEEAKDEVIDELEEIEKEHGLSIKESDLDRILPTIFGTCDAIDDAEGYEEVVNFLKGLVYYSNKPRKLSLDLINPSRKAFH